MGVKQHLATKGQQQQKFPWVLLSAILLSLAFALLANFFLQTSTNNRQLSPYSLSAHGAGALGAILEKQDIHIETVTTPAQLLELDEQSTVFIPFINDIYGSDLTQILESGAQVVLVAQEFTWNLTDWGFAETVLTEQGNILHQDLTLQPECNNSLAKPATQIGPINRYFINLPTPPACFPITDTALITTSFTAPDTHLGFWITSPKHPQVTAVASGEFFTNEYLSKYSNAAFALNLLGQKPTLYWVENYQTGNTTTASISTFPTWFTYLLWGVLGSGIWWCVYKARRFGKLVAEPMPVVVPAGEADLGRAQLYSRAHDYPHLSKILRSTLLQKLAPKYGFTSRNTPSEICHLLANHTQHSAQELLDGLYPSKLKTKQDFHTFVKYLSQIEKELQ